MFGLSDLRGLFQPERFCRFSGSPKGNLFARTKMQEEPSVFLSALHFGAAAGGIFVLEHPGELERELQPVNPAVAKGLSQLQWIWGLVCVLPTRKFRRAAHWLSAARRAWKAGETPAKNLCQLGVG